MSRTKKSLRAEAKTRAVVDRMRRERAGRPKDFADQVEEKLAALRALVTSARHSIDTAIAITRAVARGSDLRNLADAEAMLSAALRHLGQAEIQIEQVRSRIGFGAL